ncbi:WD40-repeat-containing domain protein [Chytriomyces sp. MP71]|nr:WD40-repeat-containing domain protein [Chytriomyces sp. MP71]
MVRTPCVLKFEGGQTGDWVADHLLSASLTLPSDYRLLAPLVSETIVGAPVLSVSTNASGTVLAAGTELVPNAGPEGEDVARLLLWDIRAGAAPLAQFIDCHSDDITQVRFHPTKDNIMMSGSTDTLINLFNITPDLNEEDSLYQVIKFNSINRLGFFGPSYEYLFAQTHVETYALYTFEEANIVKEFGDVRGMNVGGFQLEYLIDSVFDIGSGRLFLVAGTQSGNIGVLNVALNQMELAYTMNGGHRDIVRGVHWNMGGRSFVSGGEDGVVALWRN